MKVQSIGSINTKLTPELNLQLIHLAYLKVCEKNNGKLREIMIRRPYIIKLGSPKMAATMVGRRRTFSISNL